MIVFRKYGRIFFFAGLFCLTACGHFRHGDFTKRKYLNLKNESRVENNETAVNEGNETVPAFQAEGVEVEPIIEVDIVETEGVKDGQKDVEVTALRSETDPLETTLITAIEDGYAIYFLSDGQWYRLDSPQVESGRLLGEAVPVTAEDMETHKKRLELDVSNWYIRNEAEGTVGMVIEDIVSVKSVPFIYPKEVAVEVIPADKSEEPKGRDRYFEELTETQKAQALEDFRRIFNIGFVLFLLAAFLFVLTGYVSFMFAVPASILLVVVWIMSFFARNKVRRIDESKQSELFRFQLGLAWLISIVGGFIAVITILGGLVMLVLRVQGRI